MRVHSNCFSFVTKKKKMQEEESEAAGKIILWKTKKNETILSWLCGVVLKCKLDVTDERNFPSLIQH